MATDNLDTGTVELPATDGKAFVGQSSPLTRLHYFDGQFLRASALTLEQDYHRQAVRLGNLAGGWGVVHGLGISLNADQLEVGEGLAVTPAGSFVLAPQLLQAKLSELLQVATPPPPAGSASFVDCLHPSTSGVAVAPGLGVYEITVGPIEGLCGNEPVYGKLCESACATDSRHPYWREGVVLRLRPVTLALPVSTAIAHGTMHLRNRVASAYFAAEPWLTQSLLSANGLASDIWCRPCELYGRDEVVIGLLAREGATVRVIDAWSGRRERMDTQARGYWQGRMAMRPWNVFQAQILQFQCELAGKFDPDQPIILPEDDCEGLREILGKARSDIENLLQRYGDGAKQMLKEVQGRPTTSQYQAVTNDIQSWFADLDVLSTQLAGYVPGQGALPQKRMLLNAGFFELPPAGYLPVSLNSDVEEQVKRMFGEGVSLHFHGVAADEIGHLVEQAQHMKRISLTRGLDDPKQLEPVEVFVPDGEVRCEPRPADGTWWRAHMVADGLDMLGGLFEGTPAPTPAPAPAPVVGAPAPTPPPVSTPAPSPAPITIFNIVKTAVEGAIETATTTAKDAVDKAAEEGKKAGDAVVDEIGKVVGAAPGPFGAPRPAAPARKAAAKSRASATAPPVPEGLKLNINTNLNLPQSQYELPYSVGDLDGLLRSESRADGSHGFAMVLANDLLQGNSDTVSILGMQVQGGQVAQMLRMGLYISADIDQDLFDLHIGDSARMPIELRMLALGRGKVASMEALLTVLAKRIRPDGAEERLVQFDLQATPGGTSRNLFSRLPALRLLMARDGNGRTGFFVVDDEQLDPKSPPVHFDWDESPRHAVLYTESRERYPIGVETRDQGGVLVLLKQQAIGVGTPAASGRKEQLDLTGLPAMPPLDSVLATEAMNTLAALSDATDDAAFLVRARRRLFPVLDQPSGQHVLARRDWVMFRRARTHLCCPPCCTTQPSTAAETFQVWHLKMKTAEALGQLAKALERGDASALAGFEFRRVGLLRYRDENAVSEEPAERVVAMWRASNPAPQVVLGRTWEAAPRAGQGWQNHMRLRNMLEQIQQLTKPPARGGGAIGTIAPPPGMLGDPAYDGGMLVVTAPEQAVSTSHRVAMLPDGLFDPIVDAFKADAARGWRMLESELANEKNPIVTANLDFIDGALSADEVNELMTADENMRDTEFPHSGPSANFRIDAATVASGVNPAQQHADVLKVVADGTPDRGTAIAPVLDLGAGAQVLTLLRYQVLRG